jgi:hypothetical protein
MLRIQLPPQKNTGGISEGGAADAHALTFPNNSAGSADIGLVTLGRDCSPPSEITTISCGLVYALPA